MAVRRVRGALLRLVRRRRLTIAIGVMLAAPVVWMEFGGGTGVGWIDGLGLVVGATGIALIWSGLTGLRPDWIEGSEIRNKK
jgi:hypothetical protein